MTFEADVRTLNAIAVLLDEARMLFEAARMVLPDQQSQETLAAAAAVRDALCLRLRDQVGVLGAKPIPPSPVVSPEDMATCRLLAQGEHEAARASINAADARLREKVRFHARTAGLSSATTQQLQFTAQILDIAPLTLVVAERARSVAA